MVDAASIIPKPKRIDGYPFLEDPDGSEVLHVVNYSQSMNITTRTILEGLISGINGTTVAWDESLNRLLISSLSQEQILSLIDDALQTLPDVGITLGQAQALIAAAIGALPPPGLSQAQVQALINSSLMGLPPPGVPLDVVLQLIAQAIASIQFPPPGLNQAQVQALIDQAIANLPPPGLSQSQVQALIEAYPSRFTPFFGEVSEVVPTVEDQIFVQVPSYTVYRANSTSQGDLSQVSDPFIEILINK